MTIRVNNVIGSDSATIRDQGLAVYELAKKELKDSKKVEISFEGISIIISSFLNASIGKLYGDFSYDFIDKNLKITGLDKNDMELLQIIVIPNAKEYYSNVDKIEEIEKSVIGSEK